MSPRALLLALPAALLASLLALTGCPNPCDTEALRGQLDGGADQSPAAAAEALLGTCAPPEPLAGWLRAPDAAPPAEADAGWAEACPGGAALSALATGPRLAGLRAAYDACGLSSLGLGERDAFALGRGAPLLAAAVTRWLSEAGGDPALASRVGLALRGLPLAALPAGVALPTLGAEANGLLQGRWLVVAKDRVELEGNKLVDLADGRLPAAAQPAAAAFPTWAHPALSGLGLSDVVLAADAGVPLETLRRVAASVGAPGATVSLLGYVTKPGSTEPDAVGALPFTLPTSAEAEGLDLSQVSDVAGFAAALAAAPGSALSLGPPPCALAPAGMACVPGGAVSLGGTAEFPAKQIEISTFYIDQKEVSVGAWRACVKAGVCASVGGLSGQPDDAPVKGVTQAQAKRYCLWAGERLPSEFQWEKAARAGIEGLSGFADGPPEWTDTWAAASASVCGAACEGADPLGPCDGASGCRGQSKKVVKGVVGAAGFDPAARSTTTAGVGLRCVTPEAFRMRFPPAALTNPPPKPAPLSPPTAEQLAAFRDVAPDAIDEKPECDGPPGTVSLTCKDPMTYVRSNEGRSWIWAPYIQNLGGGYIGVGADQNYSHAANAKSEWVWLTDYDSDVVFLHRINAVLIANSATPAEFVARYAPAATAESLALIKAAYKDDPELERYVSVYNYNKWALYAWYGTYSKPSGRPVETQWLRSQELYDYVRTLFVQGRMWSFKCDLLADKAMQGIAASARKLGIPIRVYYTSNAPDVWSGALTPGYKRNVLGLPMDGRSVVLQTNKRETGYGGPTGPWHFNIQRGLEHQQLMALPGYTNVRQLLETRIPGDDIDLTISGLPSAEEPGH